MKIDNLFEEQPLYEMANLAPKFTGINGIVVWVGAGGGKLQHGPRIKVCVGNAMRSNNTATITMTDIPRVIGDIGLTQDQYAEIIEWMFLNKDLLLKLHNNQIDGNQFKQLQQTIKS